MHCFCSLDGSLATDELSFREYLDLDVSSVSQNPRTVHAWITGSDRDSVERARRGVGWHTFRGRSLSQDRRKGWSGRRIQVSCSIGRGAGSNGADEARSELQGEPSLLINNAVLRDKYGKLTQCTQDRSAEEMHADTTGFKVTEELNASQFAPHEATPLKYTSQMDEADWDAVLRNCALLYGWRIDKKTSRMVRATTPAFRLRNKTPIQPPVAPTIEETPEPTSSPKAAIENDDAPEGSISGDTYAATEASDEFEEAQPKIAKALTAEDVNAPIPAKLGAVPSYVINDRSRIEVTTAVSEFQESMAKNHFSSTSVEASV